MEQPHVVLLLPDGVWQPQLRVCLLLTPHLGRVTVLLSVVHMLSMCLAGYRYMLKEQPYLMCFGCFRLNGLRVVEPVIPCL